MPSPTKGDVHVNKPLSQISIAFLQDQRNFVSDQVFPNIPVSHQSDRYYTYDRGEFNRDEMRERAPATESAGGSYTVDNTPTYYAPVYSFHRDVDDQIRTNADSMLNLDREATAYLSHKAMIKREALWATKYFATSIWATDVTPSPLWDAASSTPIEDIQTGIDTVLQSTGFMPNTLVMGHEVWSTLKNHVDIVERIKFTSGNNNPAVVNTEAFAALFGLDRVLISRAIQNTANEGQTAAHSFILGKSALLCYSAPNPGLMIPSAGYTFSWNGMFGASALGSRVKRFRMESLASDRVEIEMAFDQKLVAADLGYFLSAVIS